MKDKENVPSARGIFATLILKHAACARSLCASSAGTSMTLTILCMRKVPAWRDSTLDFIWHKTYEGMPYKAWGNHDSVCVLSHTDTLAVLKMNL